MAARTRPLFQCDYYSRPASRANPFSGCTRECPDPHKRLRRSRYQGITGERSRFDPSTRAACPAVLIAGRRDGGLTLTSRLYSIGHPPLEQRRKRISVLPEVEEPDPGQNAYEDHSHNFEQGQDSASSPMQRATLSPTAAGEGVA